LAKITLTAWERFAVSDSTDAAASLTVNKSCDITQY